MQGGNQDQSQRRKTEQALSHIGLLEVTG